MLLICFMTLVINVAMPVVLSAQTLPATSKQSNLLKEIRKTSTINGPIYYPIASLEKSLNDRFKGFLYKDESYFNNENDGVISYAVKADDIRVSIERDGTVKTRVPMTIKVRYRAFYPILVSFLFFKRSLVIDQEREFIFDIIVHFDSKAEIQQDLSVKARTTYKIDWITTPYIVLYKFFKFNLREQVGAVFNRVFQGYSKKIDSVIISRFAPKIYIKKIVNQFNKPQLLDKESNLWVKGELFSPVKVSPIKMVGEKFISLHIETKSDIVIFFAGNDETPENVFSTSAIYDVESIRENVNDKLVYLDLFAYISPEALTYFVAKRVAENPITIETGQLNAIVTEIYFSRSRDLGATIKNKWVADIFLRSVKKNGELGGQFQIQLFFIPVYDADTGVLGITSIEYKLHTESLLLSFASLVGGEMFKDVLREKVTVSITGYITSIKEILTKKISNRRVSKNLTVRAKVGEVNVKSLVMKGDYIVIDFAVDGNVEFYLDPLF